MGVPASDALAVVVQAFSQRLNQQSAVLASLQYEISCLRRQGIAAAPPLSPAPPLASATAEPAAASPAIGSLLPHVASGAEPRPEALLLKDAECGEYYRNCMGRGCTTTAPAGLKDGDKGRVRLLLRWFNAMANEEEKAALRPARA